MTDTTLPEPLLTREQVGVILGVGPAFVYRHAAELGAVKVGKYVRFTRAGLAAYQERQTVKPPPAVYVAPEPAREPLRVIGRGPTNPLTGKPWDYPQRAAR